MQLPTTLKLLRGVLVLTVISFGAFDAKAQSERSNTGSAAKGSASNRPTSQSAVSGPKQIEFPSADGLSITADLYLGDAGDAENRPFIVLCHQAGWSRGEYRETAPRLVAMGFNCLAIDQRSGQATEGIANETARRAAAAGKPTSFVDAEPDIVAALEYVRKHHAESKLLLWGSSYSSSLALRIAGERPQLVDVVLAFAPGEYFARLGKPRDWIAQSAAKISQPAFLTSAKREANNWRAIYDAIASEQKKAFLPTTAGNHGSRALWKRFADSEAYWAAVTEFLEPLK